MYVICIMYYITCKTHILYTKNCLLNNAFISYITYLIKSYLAHYKRSDASVICCIIKVFCI